MERLLVLGDGKELQTTLLNKGVTFDYIDLRKGVEASEIMDIYETLHPEYIAELRSEIAAVNPDRMVVVGASDEYRWDGTIVCRIYGQFNSWNGQRGNKFGKTVLNVNGKEVGLIALDSVDDWDLAHEG